MNFPKTYRRNEKMEKHFDADALHVDTGTGYDCSGTLSIRTRFGACPSVWGTNPGRLN